MRVKITLACQDCKQRNYNMTKDKKTHPDRMETKKYCRFCKAHTVHKGTKWSGPVRRNRVMSKSSKEEKSNTLKRSWFQELKGEFRKITWLDKSSLARQSFAVVVSSVVLGCIIAIVDWLIQIGLNFIVG